MKLKITTLICLMSIATIVQAASNDIETVFPGYAASKLMNELQQPGLAPLMLAACGDGPNKTTTTDCPPCRAGFHNVNPKQTCTKKTEFSGAECSNSACTACLCAPN